MINQIKKYHFVLIIMVHLFYPVLAYSKNDDISWRFTVYLDNDEIGFHEFLYRKNESVEEITTKADFDVSFLFFTAYSYDHQNIERWSDNCLQKIEALTDDNGDLYRVSGERKSDGFFVSVNNEEQQYPACTKTFSYWDYRILNETALLNSQTGEIVDVQFEFIGNDEISYEGEKVDAKRYRLIGEGLQIDLWYSIDSNHWLALESITESGRVVKYIVP